MKSSFESFFGLILISLTAVGCGEPAKQSGRPNTPVAIDSDRAANSEAGSADAGKSAADNDATVEIKDFDGIQNLIAGKRGKVVVMDCWSTWCDPCVKEFPGLVELHNKFSPNDVACISLSFDYEGGKKEKPEDHVDAVTKFLRAQKAAFDNVIASVPSEELYQKLGFKTAAVPAIFVYDRDGKIAKQFESEEAKYSEVGKLVAELIEKSPTASSESAQE